ncbi:MAG: hypothetical protein A3G05_00365 [Candidatus Zambryskibacteria bacterium RIFCSPLOWO2_12_FULL_45_14]|uniref:Uncharacterized protein n=2 Tax=Candidatus Zambryskiibacteriota TaxID=1817925 RepID=A0A1G2UL96_9BACT|nr:MAG: hypothetical protein A3H60_02800 [Candidatus Zambryskibacteria bacterium RIFCSPLOWO2_02_FULL_44_12b]OHB13410.1 MAG: hypothetical protein A3G05_00365 [Candidatus Zambryskibacteria bacterium RIFCSPLOWO2_12_FULL_45_14]
MDTADTDAVLELAQKGLWTSRDGRRVCISEMDNKWLINTARLLDKFRSGNSSGKKKEGKILEVFVQEIERRGLKLYERPLCHCGKVALYVVNGEHFCKDHRDIAANKATLAMRGCDRTVWARAEEWNREKMSRATFKQKLITQRKGHKQKR